MKSNTAILITIALILGVLLSWSYASTRRNTARANAALAGSASAAESGLRADETFYDFGTISMRNGLVNHEFRITNPTDRPVTLASIVTSCMCTSALLVRPDGSTAGPFGMPGMGYIPPADDTLAPGESRVIRVVYDPNAHGPAGVGNIDRFVALTDEAGGAIQLEIKALVTP